MCFYVSHQRIYQQDFLACVNAVILRGGCDIQGDCKVLLPIKNSFINQEIFHINVRVFSNFCPVSKFLLTYLDVDIKILMVQIVIKSF